MNIKLSEKVLDISDDVSLKTLSSAIKDMKLPDEIKNITILTADELDLLPDSDFALIFIGKDGSYTRKFPVPDIDNAIASALYLGKTFNNLPDEAASKAANNILKTLNRRNFPFSSPVFDAIISPLNRIKDLGEGTGNIYREPKDTLESELRKGQKDEIVYEKGLRKELKDSDFALVGNSEKTSSKNRLFRIDTKANLEKAAAYFDTNVNLFTMEQRHKFAMAVRNKAEELKTTVKSAELGKYASREWSPIAELAVKNRVEALKDYRLEKTAEGYQMGLEGGKTSFDASVAYRKLASMAGNTDIDKFASTLYDLDRSCGLDKRYGKSISDPFTSTYKYASMIGKGDTLSGQTLEFAGQKIHINQLANLDIGDLGGMIDDLTLNELKINPAAVFESLPIPYKSVILEAIKQK